MVKFGVFNLYQNIKTLLPPQKPSNNQIKKVQTHFVCTLGSITNKFGTLG